MDRPEGSGYYISDDVIMLNSKPVIIILKIVWVWFGNIIRKIYSFEKEKATRRPP